MSKKVCRDRWAVIVCMVSGYLCDDCLCGGWCSIRSPCQGVTRDFRGARDALLPDLGSADCNTGHDCGLEEIKA